MSGYIESETDELATELCSPLPTERVIFTYTMNAIAFGLTVLALIPLLSILWEIFVRGISGLKSEMFVKSVIDYGFGNAILGTIIMVVIGAILSIPTGIMTGIFLAEEASSSFTIL